MRVKNKLISYILFAVMVISGTAFMACAEGASAVDKFNSYDRKLLCISHRGDIASYPENSLYGVKSALNKGADFVSVSLDKTSDGVFYLCERESLGNVCNAPYESLSQISSNEVGGYRTFDIFGKETEFSLTSLEKLIECTDSKDGIILDIASEEKDAVYDVLVSKGAIDRMIIRTDDSCGELVKWAEEKSERVYAIGVYGGNIIFNTISSINCITEAGMSAVQYQSKNYFNVAYGNFFVNRYLHSENARAVAVTYSPDLCGQRSDSEDGWNELIKKGYSVIETNNIEAFVAYRAEAERLEAEIADLVEKAFYIDPYGYSQISLSNLEKARLKGETLTSGIVFSLDTAQSVYSELLFTLENMKISSGEVDTRGALNITAGKLIAAVLVGSALLCGQIFVYKMRKKEK